MRPKSIHTISLLASAIALALPSTGAALGLGRLTVQSSLGQPLSAQIELTSAAREELDSIAAKIADPTLYRQNNLTYQGVLSRARVSLERSSNGQAFLRVVTANPVNEPYLDLMVELNWAAGRVVREYTFLLDPPGIAAPAPAVDPVAPRSAGVASRAAITAPAPAPARVEGRDTPRETRTPARAEGGNTYNVRRGDSLARIAGQLRPDGVTLEQMLVALFKANPSAFEGDNMNRLRSGSILAVPSAAEVTGTKDADAAKVVRMQAADWRGYRDRVAAGAPVSESANGRESTGKITAGVQERAPAAAPGKDQVRVSRESAKGGTAVEDAIANDRALKDAQVRIAELEKTLKDLQRAVEMKSQTMAQLQNQAEPGKVAGGTSPKAPQSSASSPAAVVAPPVSAPGARAPEPVSNASEPVRPPQATALNAGPSTDVNRPGTSIAPAATPNANPSSVPAAGAGAAASASSAATPKVEAPKPAVKPAGTETTVVDEVLNAPPWALGAGALALLAGIGAIFAVRRRKSSSFEDSIISGTDIKSNTVFGSTGGGIVNTGENSLSSDFSREGLSTIDTDEVDPIAEAEVYLAYGRDAQAEEILKDALKKDPQRQEVYLKLLEIHAQHNKPSAFDTVAAELYAVCHGQGEIWQKTVALGRQLDPNNPMFAEGGVPAGGVGAAALGAASVAAMRPAAESRPTPEPSRTADVPPVPVGMADLDHGMDFRLDDDISVTPSQGGKRKPGADKLSGADTQMRPSTSDVGLQFDADADRARTPERAMAREAKVESSRLAETGLEGLDFHLDDSERPASLRTPPRNESAPHGTPTLARPQAAIDLDKLDL
ncbi:MAG: hypothetical protein M3Z31_03070, partial [Pseudomonadota bacterium]|nr:hypothetical protein [Pseudomonadota bacterium]